MKRLGKVLSSVVLSCALLLGGGTTAFADDYTYTVTIYAGNQGTVAGGAGVSVASKHPSKVHMSVGEKKIVITGLSFGDNVSCNAQRTVSVAADSKYYVKGIRLSGRDNNTIAKNSAFTVVESQDYVIAYGILGEMTTYTVHYVDEEGNELADSQTYTGNVGDEPVLAYMYIDGYVPTVRNISKTLVADASQNVFEFVYTPGRDTSAAETGEGQTGDDGAGNAGNAGDVGNEGNAGGEAEGGDNAENGEANVVDIENAGGSEEERQQEINTIEDDEVPLANNSGTSASPLALDRASENGMLAPMVIGVIAAVAFLVTLILFIVFRKRRKAEDY